MASVITNSGLDNTTAALDNYADRMRYLQWGTGSGQTVSDNDLASKTGTTESRIEGMTSQQTENVSNDTYRVNGTITAEGSRAITEVGVFDGAGSGSPPSGNDMGMYGDFSVINLEANDSITYTIEVTFSDGS